MMGPLSDGLLNQTTDLMLVGRISAELSTITDGCSFLDDCYSVKSSAFYNLEKLFTGGEHYGIE